MEPLTHHSCSIIPPYLLTRLAGLPTPDFTRASSAAARTLEHIDAVQQVRVQGVLDFPSPVRSGLNRTISDAGSREVLPGEPVRHEGQPATGDAAVDEAYDGLGHTYALFHNVFDRSSIDGSGGTLAATVHYGDGYDNAFWNGARMVFGDGDGEVFTRFTRSVTVIGHELAHGFVLAEAPLEYQGQPGALQESVADIFGVLVEQHLLNQDVESASWLVGAGLFTDQVQGQALRSLKAPGTAYDDDILGKDPQPGSMDSYVDTTQDRGGVHINSGIPNRAFYLCAASLGGFAWERAGRIWYHAIISGQITATYTFAEFASLTLATATTQFGAESPEATATAYAWRETGVLP